ncbi:hypothetical protein M422DRAFT_263455 [Sphaerobolus stellatus SS14]|uniref:SWIM-type domain-containing protein n=1 Tax=Sphaerobolus stellatus (strain SS14) TaxID=990650 RepID=A0A0C9UYY8_SPHS4|nr:hypothetical protein M422DRAFT_263455 [Sphaerobolus stellatus SS14]
MTRNNGYKNRQIKSKGGGRTHKKPFEVRWATVTAEEARGDRVEISAARSATKIPWKSLDLTAGQHASLESMYESSSLGSPGTEIEDHTFSAVNDIQQNEAISRLTAHGLNETALEDVTCRWSVKWAATYGSGEHAGCRTLYQCDCGREHTQFGSKKRHTAYNFSGCLAHAEVTILVKSGRIQRIHGYFHHNDECKQAVISRMPPIPLHPSVYSVALKQLHEGASLTAIQARNRELFRAQAYPGQPSHEDFHSSQYRWIMKGYDTRALYRQYNRMIGVDTQKKPHINIDEWLDPKSSHYNPILAEAVFHYSARAALNQRFEVCVATQEMKEAAWKHGYQSQIMLDGTFGICDSKLLLFILMAVDEKGKGVPFAFLLFSAPSGNKQTSSGYDTEILTKLLQKWRADLEKLKGRSFEVLVAVTDTDLKERGALLVVFPGVLLLICKFHIRQSWRNYRNKVLKGQSPLLMQTKARLKRVEDELIQTTEFSKAKALLHKEREILTVMKVDSETTSAGERGLLHVEYLDSYWCSESLWQSWADFGRRMASLRLKCTFEGVLPTTNHLESFNGLLKRKHLQRWQRGGRRLRIDMLLQILVLKVLPSIFEQRHLEAMEDQRWIARIQALPGGDEIIKGRTSTVILGPVVAYLVADQQRDQAATLLLQQGCLSAPAQYPQGIYFNCYSSLRSQHEANPIMYQVQLFYWGSASCTCSDFVHRGGACKHIRAALLRMNFIRQSGSDFPLIQLPRSETEAQLRQLSCMETSRKVSMLDDAPIAQAAASITDLLNEVPEAYIEGDLDEFVSGSQELANIECEDDAESVATDAEDELDFTIIKSSKEALDAQSLARFTHEARTAAPKLGDLAAILPDHEVNMSYDQLNDLFTFRETLALLLHKVDRMLPSNHASKKSQPDLTLEDKENVPLVIGPSQRSRAVIVPERQALLPPSPEKSQKRKQSYSFH